MSEYFPKPKPLEGSVKVKLDFSNFVTKSDFKNATGFKLLKYLKKVDLASLNQKLINWILVNQKLLQLI